MQNVLIAGPATGNLVVYSQSGRSSYLGVVLNWLGTDQKVVYGFDRDETLWANQVMVIRAPQESYSQMCTSRLWNRFLAGTIDRSFITAQVFDGRMNGRVCELRFSPLHETEIWVPLDQVLLVAHLDARQPPAL